MTERRQDERIQRLEVDIERVLRCTPVPTLMFEVKEYARLHEERGYDAGYDAGVAEGPEFY